MALYRTQLDIHQLDTVITGDLPWLDLKPFSFRYNGERKGERFVLRRGGMVIRGTLQTQGDILYVTLRPRYTLILVLCALVGASLVSILLFAEPLKINGEDATIAMRLIHLPLALLFPTAIFAAFHFQMKFWTVRVLRSMKLERVDA